MTTDNFCCYLQNRLIQTKQEVNSTVILPPLVFPDETVLDNQDCIVIKAQNFCFIFVSFCTILFRIKIFSPCPISQSLTHGLKLNQAAKVLLHSVLLMTDSLQPCPILKSLTHGCKLCQKSFILLYCTILFMTGTFQTGLLS
jgi:hypothetical protein